MTLQLGSQKISSLKNGEDPLRKLRYDVQNLFNSNYVDRLIFVEQLFAKGYPYTKDPLGKSALASDPDPAPFYSYSFSPKTLYWVMPFENSPYLIIKPTDYMPYLPALAAKLPLLLGNWVTYKKEIHRESRFAICQYKISHQNNQFELVYDAEKSKITANEKKTHTDPELLNCEDIRQILYQFLVDINDQTLTRVEVKLIQTDVFPFEFNPHRDSQFKRLRHIKYLATVIVSCENISGGNMQLFHSDGDQVGPFHVIEELPANVGAGYIVDELPHIVFHGMRTAMAVGEGAHRGALLLRFF